MSSITATELFSVRGLVAVITGGGTGIGLMMAKALEANGAKVYIIGRRQEVLEKAAKVAVHGNIIPLQGDVSSKEDLTRMVDTITAAEGFINLLVANSGIGGPTLGDLKPNPTLSEFREFLWNTDQQAFTQTYHINTSAVFFTVVAFLNLLGAGNEKGNVEQKSQVIATSSVGAFNRIPLGYAYGTSKAAVLHLLKQFATTFVPFEIRSNVIAPGYYPSEMTSDILAKGATEGKFPRSVIPLQRAGTEEDMAATILYLASKGGAYLNGNVVVTDGGRLCILPSTY
ncbi:uncharacterized protein BP5553_00176 [Venustampulla echinocandica]|uniref:NAD(P)-binding protein n=1 Tax=Venustampulla echinocandica TaxID=2656787 RepID=A0A370TXE7_9HELO|nr:uncharacterized protein BP5553_00176 [Venustampulla echinocandica]RDL40197.1 hypothetical protein BP5553_00176 [Venustampulla echinocandica]